MIREELVKSLEIVSPALADNDLLPVLTNFCFTNKQVFAFNDQIAIAVPLDAGGLKGAVPGKVLLAILRNSTVKEATLTPKDRNLELKLGKAKVTLALTPPESFIFDLKLMGIGGSEVPIADWKDFVAAVDTCMRSVGTDTGTPDQLGITIIPDGKQLLLFSTNNSTLSHSKVALAKPASFKKRVILPASFCKQISVIGAMKTPYLEINETHALLVGGPDLAEVQVFGRLLESDQPIDFAHEIERNISPAVTKSLVPKPANLSYALDRAIVITDSAADQGSTLMAVKEGLLVMTSETTRGEVIDRLDLPDHPDVVVRVEPKQLRNGLDFADHIAITTRCIVLSRGTSIYLVAAHGK